MPSGHNRLWAPFPLNGKKLNEFLENVGVRGLEVKELFDHPKSFDGLRAIILFYKWHPDEDSLKHVCLNNDKTKFIPRCITPTLALMDNIMSLDQRDGFQLGPQLIALKKFISPMDSSLRFAILNSNEFIRTAHNDVIRLDNSRDEVSYDQLWYHAVFDPHVNDGYGSSSASSSDDAPRRFIERIDYYLRRLRYNSTPHHLFGIFEEVPSYDSGEDSSRAHSQMVDEIQRNHNYSRFMVEMCKIMSSQGVLKDAITKELRSAAASESEEGSNRAMDDDDDVSIQQDSRSISSRSPSSSESERRHR